MRSRSAASILITAGLKTVYSLDGGIKAWQGRKAAGAPEAGMSFFPADAKAEELIALAWILEEGSRKFYSAVAGMPGIVEGAKLFTDLVVAEEHHKASLLGLYIELTGRGSGPEFPKGVLRAESDEDRMEGGIKLSEALSWAAGKNTRDVLELAMALETDSCDLYIKMGRKVPDANAHRVFNLLIAEEKEHLNSMARLMDSLV
jgi:rubrerythrin